ncbi:MAG: GNAT family N-acetyltransferase [Alphaproteobacteria bacterium]|nr:GNAT family N-acetyltransferase [Alphaproteobacteria bacterium]
MSDLAFPSTLRTPRLRLSAWRLEDVEALRAALDASDAHLRPWIPFMRAEPRSIEQTRSRVAGFIAFFVAGQHFRYAVWRQPDGALVGEVMLLGRAGPHALEVGYWLHSAHTGQGYAIEAVRALVDAAFTHPDIEALRFRCDVRNTPSNALPRKLGARVITTETLEEDGAPVVLNVWSLDRSEG